MPVKNTWIIENRILLTEIIGAVTSDELIASSRLGTEMIESGIAPVYSLVDLSQMGQFPLRLNEFSALFRQSPSKKMSWMFICGIPNQFASFIATTFAQVTRSGYKVAKTRDEAMRMIEEIEGQPIA
jgi:hypothetical protein